MSRNLAARRAVCCLLIVGSVPREARSQTWNDRRSRALAELATARRAEQLADTALTDYQADAHGYVTFLAQLGEGFPEPPKIVKADQLALEVYWRAPNLSKQRIIGRRDTLLLPTDIAYHSDHLGIVQNNFPDIIRLGEGDEVRDAPHPLSPAGLRDYDFAISDSLRISLPGRVINVYEVKVRPRDDRKPRVIGAVYIDPDGGQVVRMAFTFTHAAFLDDQLEDLSIVLENGLVGTRFWLPRRQEIEIRRTGTWMEYPVRGLIRGRWEIGNYRINQGLSPQLFAGPEIVQAPADVQRRYPWQGRVLDSLPPDVRAVSDRDVQRVQAEARALVRARALERGRALSLSARGISDFARVDRVEGLSFGAGVTQPLGRGYTIRARGRYGLDDREGKGEMTLSWHGASDLGVSLFARSDFGEAGSVQEVSRIRNSLAAQEFGSDYTDPYQVRAAGVSVDLRGFSGLRPRLVLSYEAHEPRSIHAAPASGHYGPTIAADETRGARLGLELDRPTILSFLGTEVRAAVRLSVAREEAGAHYAAVACPTAASLPRGCGTSWRFDGGPDPTLVGRVSVDLAVERPFGDQRLVTRTLVDAARGSRGVTAQDLAFFGGPSSGPGYDFHELVGTRGFDQHVEWHAPITFPALPLGRFGHATGRATLAPFADVAGIDGLDAPAFADLIVRRRLDPSHARVSGLYPAVGGALLMFFDVLRFDVARGLRDGRWTFSVDVSRDLWGIL